MHDHMITLSYSTLLIVVRMITEYCSCADDLPMLVTDILNKLIDLLKVTV